jgi:flagellar hook assembly protein FlgD
VHNIIGQEIATLVDTVQSAGDHSVVWDGKSVSGGDVAAGMYLLSFRAGDVVRVEKMLLVK